MKQFGAAVVDDPIGMAKRAGNAMVNADPDRAAELVGETLFIAGASAALKTPEAAAVASRVGAALNDAGVKTMLLVTKGTSWRSYYDSFAPGTARLRFSFGRRTLYGGANSKGAGTFEEFASIERPLRPVDAILHNALHPTLTSNRARCLYQVTTRRGFSIDGVVAPQGTFPGEFHQVFQPKLFNRSPWFDVRAISY